MIYVVGIDGGGSTVRAVVMDENLSVVGQSAGGAVNPNLVGRAAAAGTIQTAVRAALAKTALTPEQIGAVGIGVAGADAAHSADWLRETVRDVLPGAVVAASSDHEIALAGAHGERRGILVLAGTGSLACGANSAGDYVRVGGWGYLLGDEGSGFWLGMEGLRMVARAADGRSRQTGLTAALLERLGLADAGALAAWLYWADTPRNPEVAALAGLVLEQAALGETAAQTIVEQAARELALAARAVQHRLNMEPLPLAFAGGLLTAPNPLSSRLCELLGLADIPVPRYPPVVGAAILALHHLKHRG
jgi:N-acetylglucosamine kinase-like BadF-type ATPase